MDCGFEIKCKKCGCDNVQVTQVNDGIKFDCMNLDCERQMYRALFHENGLYEYEDNIYDEL